MRSYPVWLSRNFVKDLTIFTFWVISHKNVVSMRFKRMFFNRLRVIVLAPCPVCSYSIFAWCRLSMQLLLRPVIFGRWTHRPALVKNSNRSLKLYRLNKSRSNQEIAIEWPGLRFSKSWETGCGCHPWSEKYPDGLWCNGTQSNRGAGLNSRWFLGAFWKTGRKMKKQFWVLCR